MSNRFLFTTFDIEVYPNYFCFVAQDWDMFGNKLETYFVDSQNERITSAELKRIEVILSGRQRSDEFEGKFRTNDLKNEKAMREMTWEQGGYEHYIISFNGARYDLSVLAKIRRDVLKHDIISTLQIFHYSNDLITYDNHSNRINRNFLQHKEWNEHHFDMLSNCLLTKSLKQWEMYTNKDIKELPYDVGTYLSPNQQLEVLDYCCYDVQALSELFFQYGYDKSYAQNPTLLSYRELYKLLPEFLQDRFDRTPSKLAVASVYHDLAAIPCRTTNPFDLFEMDDFNVPVELKNLFIIIQAQPKRDPSDKTKKPSHIWRGIEYGTGGAHYMKTGFHSNLVNYDVASMYPSILINWKLIKTLEARERYQNFRDTRLSIKKLPEYKSLSNGLKLAMNSFSGELRCKSPYLASYDPAAGDAMCYIGQLVISELANIILEDDLVEVNTDGLMYKDDDRYTELVPRIIDNMEKRFNLLFEREQFAHIYARDVNNYVIYDSTGKWVNAKGDRYKDYMYKNHIRAVTDILFTNLVQYSLRADWDSYEWTDYIYKYHKSAASKYASIDGEPMKHKNYYFLWTTRNCPNSASIMFSRDLINKKTGSIKSRWGIWGHSLNDLTRGVAYLDIEQYQRDLDDDFELWGRDDLCTTRVPKEQRKSIKSISDIFPAL